MNNRLFIYGSLCIIGWILVFIIGNYFQKNWISYYCDYYSCEYNIDTTMLKDYGYISRPFLLRDIKESFHSSYYHHSIKTLNICGEAKSGKSLLSLEYSQSYKIKFRMDLSNSRDFNDLTIHIKDQFPWLLNKHRNMKPKHSRALILIDNVPISPSATLLQKMESFYKHIYHVDILTTSQLCGTRAYINPPFTTEQCTTLILRHLYINKNAFITSEYFQNYTQFCTSMHHNPFIVSRMTTYILHERIPNALFETSIYPRIMDPYSVSFNQFPNLVTLWQGTIPDLLGDCSHSMRLILQAISFFNGSPFPISIRFLDFFPIYQLSIDYPAKKLWRIHYHDIYQTLAAHSLATLTDRTIHLNPLFVQSLYYRRLSHDLCERNEDIEHMFIYYLMDSIDDTFHIDMIDHYPMLNKTFSYMSADIHTKFNTSIHAFYKSWTKAGTLTEDQLEWIHTRKVVSLYVDIDPEGEHYSIRFENRQVVYDIYQIDINGLVV